ncbi:uncharacterized protein [Typha angustifolia]|uniref:uncharacterized protein n=1 Tax=Typha angustifolia TaxID=59011 RepID=UPI003C2F33E3
MEIPVSDPGPVKESGSSFPCNYCDTDLVHKIAQLFLPGLATACMDNTTGDLFRSPSSVAVAMRKEMVDYLTHRSETFVAESVVGGDGLPDEVKAYSNDLDEIISVFIDDFTSSKRNLFSRVSGWVLSESREDKIDDFMQEMEMNNFWSLDRREAIAEVLLKNIDIKGTYHCTVKFDTEQQLEEHRGNCSFRPVYCTNEGCDARFSAVHMVNHDLICSFKVLPCEQGCSQSLMRREMDRHCITVCPMKLVNCPFYQVGCESAFPQCTLEKHCSEFLQSHLLYVLQVIYKHQASVEDVQQRVQLLEKSQSLSELSEALDVRSLALAIKEQEARTKKLERDFSKVG